MPSLQAVEPFHVAAYVEPVSRERFAPTAKQHLAAIRYLFDWLVVGQILSVNPAASVRGSKHVASHGKTPVFAPGLSQSLEVAVKGPGRSRASRREPSLKTTPTHSLLGPLTKFATGPVGIAAPALIGADIIRNLETRYVRSALSAERLACASKFQRRRSWPQGTGEKLTS